MNNTMIAARVELVDPHRNMLAERNGHLISPNNEPDEAADQRLAEMTAVESRLIATPARTLDGMAAKLLLLMQLIAEGHEIDEVTAVAAVREAMQVAGMGSLASMPPNVLAAIGEGR